MVQGAWHDLRSCGTLVAGLAIGEQRIWLVVRIWQWHPMTAACAQTAMALAVAEEACGFEHRDLHWGNLLLQRGAPPGATCHLR